MKSFYWNYQSTNGFMLAHSTTQLAISPLNANPKSQEKPNINSVLGVSIILLPIALVLSINAYRKYRVAALRRQIAILERLWQVDIKK
jgi:hypothetical protein